MLETIFFYAFGLLALGGGVGTVTLRNPVHSAISLIVSLLGAGGIYLLQQAEFLFAVQIIIYIGGIMVLFLFVIMLVNLDQSARERQYSRQLVPAVLCAFALVAEAAWFVTARGHLGFDRPTAGAPGGNTEQLADLLFTDYLLPFEAASLLLLVAVIGSVFMARKPE